MTKATQALAALFESGLIRRFSGSAQAVYYTLAIVCADGPRVLSAEQIAWMTGLSVRTTTVALNELVEMRFVECVPIVAKGSRRKFTGRWSMVAPAKIADLDRAGKSATLTA